MVQNRVRFRCFKSRHFVVLSEYREKTFFERAIFEGQMILLPKLLRRTDALRI